MKFFIAILCLNVCSVAFGFENETFAMAETPNQCVELNQQRMDLRDCCDYPRIHFFRIFSSRCVDECVGTKDICCSMLCVWRNTRITFTEEGGVNLAGLKQTLLESVVHKDEWFNLIHKAVDQCDSETGQNLQNPFDKMCNIPTHLPALVNCAIKRLFLMCPSMHKSQRCETTRKYVEDCL